jgi:hypothetical protein
MLPYGVNHVVSGQQSHLPLAVTREDFRDETPDQWLLEEISIDQVKHVIAAKPPPDAIPLAA